MVQRLSAGVRASRKSLCAQTWLKDGVVCGLSALHNRAAQAGLEEGTQRHNSGDHQRVIQRGLHRRTDTAPAILPVPSCTANANHVRTRKRRAERMQVSFRRRRGRRGGGEYEVVRHGDQPDVVCARVHVARKCAVGSTNVDRRCAVNEQPSRTACDGDARNAPEHVEKRKLG